MRNVVNYGVEKFNENYLDFMREGEYDPYQDNISYTTIPVDNNSGKTDIAKNAAKYFGPLSPIIGTAVLAGERLTEPEKKTQEAIDRANKDLMVRVPLEIAGNVGLIPLYKDVRKVMMKEMYKDMDQSSSGKPSQGGLTKEEMKKYLPEVYKQMQEWRSSCASTIRLNSQVMNRGTPSMENELWNVNAQLLNGKMKPQDAANKIQAGFAKWYAPAR